jgi:hypothetical protein
MKGESMHQFEWLDWRDVAAVIIVILDFIVYAACIAGFMYVIVHFVIKYW